MWPILERKHKFIGKKGVAYRIRGIVEKPDQRKGRNISVNI